MSFIYLFVLLDFYNLFHKVLYLKNALFTFYLLNEKCFVDWNSFLNEIKGFLKFDRSIMWQIWQK